MSQDVPVVSKHKLSPSARTDVSTLKETATCPACVKHITMHGVKYTHQRYCKSTSTSANTKDTITPDIEDTPPVRNPGYSPEPLIIPASEQIAALLVQDRNMKAEKKKPCMISLRQPAF